MYQCLMKLVELHSMTLKVEHPVPDPNIQVFSHFIVHSLPSCLLDMVRLADDGAESCSRRLPSSSTCELWQFFYMQRRVCVLIQSLNPKYKTFWTCDKYRLLGIMRFGTPSFASRDRDLPEHSRKVADPVPCRVLARLVVNQSPLDWDNPSTLKHEGGSNS